MKTATHPAAPSPDFFSVDEIGQLSVGLFGSERAAERLKLLGLQSAWGRAVGSHLCAVTRPASCDGGTLVVDVRDVAWKRELDRLKPEILARLAKLLPSHTIADLTFRVRKTAGDEAATRPARSGPAVERPAPLKHTADVDLVDLKDRLSGVMGRYLARARPL